MDFGFPFGLGAPRPSRPRRAHPKPAREKKTIRRDETGQPAAAPSADEIVKRLLQMVGQDPNSLNNQVVTIIAKYVGKFPEVTRVGPTAYETTVTKRGLQLTSSLTKGEFENTWPQLQKSANAFFDEISPVLMKIYFSKQAPNLLDLDQDTQQKLQALSARCEEMFKQAMRGQTGVSYSAAPAALSKVYFRQVLMERMLAEAIARLGKATGINNSQDLLEKAAQGGADVATAFQAVLDSPAEAFSVVTGGLDSAISLSQTGLQQVTQFVKKTSSVVDEHAADVARWAANKSNAELLVAAHSTDENLQKLKFATAGAYGGLAAAVYLLGTRKGREALSQLLKQMGMDSQLAKLKEELNKAPTYFQTAPKSTHPTRTKTADIPTPFALPGYTAKTAKEAYQEWLSQFTADEQARNKRELSYANFLNMWKQQAASSGSDFYGPVAASTADVESPAPYTPPEQPFYEPGGVQQTTPPPPVVPQAIAGLNDSDNSRWNDLFGIGVTLLIGYWIFRHVDDDDKRER